MTNPQLVYVGCLVFVSIFCLGVKKQAAEGRCCCFCRCTVGCPGGCKHLFGHLETGAGLARGRVDTWAWAHQMADDRQAADGGGSIAAERQQQHQDQQDQDPVYRHLHYGSEDMALSSPGGYLPLQFSSMP